MKRLKVYGLTCALFLFAALANATTIVMPSDDDLIGKSPVIVDGRVVSSATVEQDGRIWTETVVTVDRTLKGSAEETIVVREIGGELDGRVTKIYGTPEFKNGERVLLFLDRSATGGYRTVDLFVGKFHSASMIDGRRLWYRADSAQPVTLLDQDFQPIAASNVQREANGFEAFVRERVAGRAGVANYGVANPVLAREQTGRGIQANFTLISEPTVYRWTMFDSGQTANWYSGGTQPGYSGGGVTELQQAMSAWTGYAQAKIRYAYAGSRSAPFGGLTTRNSFNEVLFNDPLSEIAGTFSGSGVVGTGGFNGVSSTSNWTSPFAFDAAHPQGTMRVYNITEGNLTIQDGVTPGNGISSNRLAEIISHEFGHTLGFGHSPDGTALMYASVTGRGPALKDDDQIAARWLYPNGNVTPPPPAPQGPAAPSGVIATASASSITLEWSDNSNNESGFSIYLSADGGNFAKVADAAANTERATLSGLPAATYRAYVVAFNATGVSAQSNIVTATIAGSTLTAAFSFTPQTGTAGVTQFTFYDESRGASTRRWDFGDGTSSTAAVVNKVYARADRYTVTLTVTSAAGTTASTSHSVTVSGALAAAFSFTPANPTTDDTINFTDESTGGITSWRWVFGDGESASAQNPSKRYFNASTYTVTLTVFRNSESATLTKTITVRNSAPVTPPVEANFDFAPSSPTVGASVTFTDRSTGTPTNWSWSFGDGRTSTVRNPVITFNAPGTYSVSVTASNAGSSSTYTQPVVVVPHAPHRSLVSVTTQTNGAGGTYWRTELTVLNAGEQGASVTLVFLPTAGGSVITRNLFLSPKQSVTYGNTLLDLFGVPNGAGAVAIEATSASANAQLRISSRTYTEGARGTYGQAVPDVASLDKTLYITGMQSNASYRTNVGLVNRADTDTGATLTLYNSSGSTVSTANVVIPARNFQQAPLSSFFPEVAGRSYDVLSMRIVASAAEAISAYASVIDNRTQDPVYVQAMPASATGSLTIPVVGRAPGANGTFWRSDVSVFNPTAESLFLTIHYGDDTDVIALGARDTVVLGDVLSEFGLTSGQGALKMTWNSGVTGPIVTSRTYTSVETGGTFGQSIDPVMTFANESFVPGLRSDSSYRSNIGFVNGGTTAESFTVTLLSPSGAQIGSTSYMLAPGGQAQTAMRSLFPNVSQSAGNFTLVVRGDGNAKLFAYGSMVDNTSGDPVFFAGR